MLILVRHGRTVANAEGRLQGRLDLDLDELGRRQAVAVAALVEDTVGTVDTLISSPLKRAMQTADAFGLPYTVEDRWVEVSYGQYEGVPHADVPSEVWDRWRSDLDFVPAGGESLSALDHRVRGACEEIVERAADEHVVVVSHVSPMKSAVAWALGVGIEISWNCHLDHASMCKIRVRGRRPILLTFNETVAVS